MGERDTYCAPGALNKYGSCFTFELLQKIARDINQYNNENNQEGMISERDINSNFKHLQKKVHEAYKNLIPK